MMLGCVIPAREIVIAALLLGVVPFVAAEKPLPVKKIMTLVESHANKNGCVVDIDPKNVIRFNVEGKSRVVVLYHIDVGCSGGTAMHRPAFAMLAEKTAGDFQLIPEYSLPSATSQDFPQYTNTISVKGNDLWYSGKEFNWGSLKPGEEGDALCCPSLEVKGRVTIENGKWLDSRGSQ